MITEGGGQTHPTWSTLVRVQQRKGFLLPQNPENPGRIQQKRLSLIELGNKGKFPAFPSAGKKGTMEFRQ
jgi:hypothetical protein